MPRIALECCGNVVSPRVTTPTDQGFYLFWFSAVRRQFRLETPLCRITLKIESCSIHNYTGNNEIQTPNRDVSHHFYSMSIYAVTTEPLDLVAIAVGYVIAYDDTIQDDAIRG